MHASVRGDGNRAMMSTERRKVLSGEVYDAAHGSKPGDPQNWIITLMASRSFIAR